MPKFFQIWPLTLFQLGPMSCSHTQSMFVCALFYLFFQIFPFWHYRILQVSCTFFILVLKATISPRNPCSFGEWCNQDLSPICAHCYWGVLACRPFQMSGQKNIYAYIASHMPKHIYKYFYVYLHILS